MGKLWVSDEVCSKQPNGSQPLALTAWNVMGEICTKLACRHRQDGASLGVFLLDSRRCGLRDSFPVLLFLLDGRMVPFRKNERTNERASERVSSREVKRTVG